MESENEDESNGHGVDKTGKSSPNGRLESRGSSSSSSSSSVQSSDFEDPSQGEEGGTLKSPPTQKMERPPESSGPRIPSHVFARNKSGNPADWSVNSNESLFSLQLGTTSFTQEQFNWMTKSGELNPEGSNKNVDPHHPTSEKLDSSSSEPAESPSEKTHTEKSAADDSTTPEIASTSKEPATVNEEEPETKSEIHTDHNSNPNTKSPNEDQRHSARESDASGQSFAFPLLVADMDGGNSGKSGHTPKEKSTEQTQPQPSTDQVQAQTTEAAQSFSWFSRCVAFCSCRQ